MFFLNIYWYVTYGVWTVLNYLKYVQAPESCIDAKYTLMKAVYNVAMVVGAFPAVLLTVFLLFSSFYVPYIAVRNCLSARTRYMEKRLLN